ncbi:MAG: hypothetical protein COS89_00800 [Deltaproteobacteria bacterium CG07_land_8_20_14_0_80_38_7]|nr:MAG: hypothetical protein COS89_00800 [Deltaproteobacteria bacterium CG07_land_8_20_14_0_80_38_7]
MLLEVGNVTTEVIMTPYEFSHQLELLHQGELESVVLYGSAVSSDFSKKLSDYNIIVILKDPSPVKLARSQKLVKKWVGKGNPPPLFFDPTHIERSLDVFPLEFLDISDRHQVLLGEDPFKNIHVELTNLRHQCESELKGKLLTLRSLYSIHCNKPRLVADLMLKTFSGFLSVFKGVLHLLNEKPDKAPEKIIEQLIKHLDFNLDIFFDIILVKNGKRILPRKTDALVAFEKYLMAIEEITDFVDRMEE